MYRRLVITSFAFLSCLAAAQTPVTTTTGGTIGRIPLFTTGANVENSTVTQSSGNIGIGTITPAATLDVNGISRISVVPVTVLSGTSLTLGPSPTGMSVLNITNQAGNAAEIISFTNYGSYTAPGGAVTPGTIYAMGSGGPNVSGGGGTKPHENTFFIGNNSTGAIPFLLGPTGNLGLGGNITLSNLTGAGMVILGSNSYVGVGTTNPTALFEVNGNMKLSSGSAGTITFADGTVQSTAYTGGSSSPGSVITTSGSNVGIGTTTPAATLDVNGYFHASGNTNPTTSVQGAYFGWNALTGSIGETDFINNQGGGTGGFAFMNTPSNGTPKTTLMFLNGTGNLGLGTTIPGSKLEVNGNVKLTAGSGASITFADGTVQSTAYTGVNCGGDYAETVDVAGSRTSYEPGDVLVVGNEDGSDVTKSSEAYSTLVAGIYSTKPGVVGRRQTTDPKTSTTEIPMAMVGIVPTKVTAENGPIRRGDLLVSSSTIGFAMKGTDRSRMLGAVLGKALGSLDSGSGVIEVLVTLQ